MTTLLETVKKIDEILRTSQEQVTTQLLAEKIRVPHKTICKALNVLRINYKAPLVCNVRKGWYYSQEYSFMEKISKQTQFATTQFATKVALNEAQKKTFPKPNQHPETSSRSQLKVKRITVKSDNQK